ncbi:hypothetical protein FV242_16180 [Methylobacterium sp. WL64]|uniref:hypothetical protein n=1 Tax=Methylobacterium sp. WL64 TaxID=2603894 RepID=UPI0011D4B552|nr:hypothetical protein [Methylobacterium sp. WL64]TXN02135.1 hypothetical protein FV242_16180 [Methylobacterium sp. WL64]
MPMAWIEALIAINEEIVACERRFQAQCAKVVEKAANGQDAAEDEMLLGSYKISLILVRAHRDSLLADVPTDA